MSAKKANGYAGKILRIDLTNERITEEVLDEPTLQKWVGVNQRICLEDVEITGRIQQLVIIKLNVLG